MPFSRRVASLARLGRLALLIGLVGTVGFVGSPPRAASAQGASKDIVDTAAGAGQFTTLVKAVQAAGLVDTLKGPGPFTVFAPTDAAFAKLPAGTLDSLLANPAQLRAVLTYHVVAGRVTSADLPTRPSANSVQGAALSFTTAGGPKVNNANIVQADIQATNGVIHVIDAVLLPPGASASPGQLPRAGEADSVLPGLMAAAAASLLIGGLWMRRRAFDRE